MKVLAAYLLAKVGGNDEPSAEDIKKILASVGIEAQDEKLELLLSQVRGKDLAELIASGREKMSSVACVAGPVAVAASAGVAGASAAADATKEEEVEEKKEQSDEEDGGLFGLFD